MTDFEELLAFWFGPLDDQGRADAEHEARWWKHDPAFDATLRERFAALHRRVAAGECEAWLTLARGQLAYVIVLDQL